MPSTIAGLHEISDEHLVGLYDSHASAPRNMSRDDLVAELQRRRLDKQTACLIRLTWAVLILTVVNIFVVAVSTLVH